MSLISKQIDELRAYAKDSNGELAKLINDAAYTIEVLSAKLHASNMERSSQYYNDGWISCNEMLPDEYGEYLVTKRTFGWNCEEYVSNDIAYFDNDGFHKADTVIAWMPLPEPHRAERRTDGVDR